MKIWIVGDAGQTVLAQMESWCRFPIHSLGEYPDSTHIDYSPVKGGDIVILSWAIHHRLKTDQLADLVNSLPDPSIHRVVVTDYPWLHPQGRKEQEWNQLAEQLHFTPLFYPLLDYPKANPLALFRTTSEQTGETAWYLWQAAYRALKRCLEKSIYVIGKAVRYQPDPLHELFSQICFVKCTQQHHRDDPRFCCTVNTGVLKRHSDFLDFHRTEQIKIVTARPITHGKVTPLKETKKLIQKYCSKYTKFNLTPEHFIVNKPEDTYDYPHLEDCIVGHPSTGTGTLQYLAPQYEAIYVSGFSHFASDGSIKKPDKKLVNAYNKRGGRHSNEYEYYLMQELVKRHPYFYVL